MADIDQGPKSNGRVHATTHRGHGIEAAGAGRLGVWPVEEMRRVSLMVGFARHDLRPRVLGGLTIEPRSLQIAVNRSLRLRVGFGRCRRFGVLPVTRQSRGTRWRHRCRSRRRRRGRAGAAAHHVASHRKPGPRAPPKAAAGRTVREGLGEGRRRGWARGCGGAAGRGAAARLVARGGGHDPLRAILDLRACAAESIFRILI